MFFEHFMMFCIYDYMQDIYETLTDNLKHIYDLMKNIKMSPNIENPNHLWNFCVNSGIDFLRTELENRDNVINNGFGQSGYIVQFFSIFKENDSFYIKEKRNEKCEICINIKEFNETYHSLFLFINENNIKFNRIYTIAFYNLICEKYNLGDNFPTYRL